MDLLSFSVLYAILAPLLSVVLPSSLFVIVCDHLCKMKYIKHLFVQCVHFQFFHLWFLSYLLSLPLPFSGPFSPFLFVSLPMVRELTYQSFSSFFKLYFLLVNTSHFFDWCSVSPKPGMGFVHRRDNFYIQNIIRLDYKLS